MGILSDVEGVASSVFNWIVGGLGSVADTITDTAKGLFSLGEWIYRAFVDGLKWIYNAFIGLADRIKNALITAYDYLKDGLTAIGHYIGSGLTAIGNAMKDALTTAYDYLKSALVTIGEKIYDGLKEVASVISNLARWIWDKLVDFAHWLFDKIVSFVKFLVGVMWRILSGVADIFERFFNWVKGKMYALYKDTTRAIGGFFSNILTDARDKFAEMVAFNITFNGIESGVPLILSGKYKDGVRNLLLAPFLGALSGAFLHELLRDKTPNPEKIIFAPKFTDMEEYDVFNIDTGSYIEAVGSLKFYGYVNVTIGESVEPIYIEPTTYISIHSNVSIKIAENIFVEPYVPIAIGSYVNVTMVSSGGGYYGYNSYSGSSSSSGGISKPPNVSVLPT